MFVDELFLVITSEGSQMVYHDLFEVYNLLENNQLGEIVMKGLK